MRGLVAIILVTNFWWNVNAGQQRGLKLQADDSILSFGQNSDVKLYRGKGEKNKGGLYIDAPGGIFSESLQRLINAQIDMKLQGVHAKWICDVGWTGRFCDQDIDECLKNNGGCDSKRKCTSTPGSMKCGDCPAGYANDGAKGCKARKCTCANGTPTKGTACNNNGASCQSCHHGFKLNAKKTACVAATTCVSNGKAGTVDAGTNKGKKVPAGIPCTGWYMGKNTHSSGFCQGTGYGGNGWCGVEAPPGKKGKYTKTDAAWAGCSKSCKPGGK